MQSVGQKNTGPEIVVRKALHAMGYRFRLHAKHLPGKPDIVLPKWNAVIFVHGCFWHGHGCPKGRLPKSKLGYWSEKIESNQQRDSRTKRELTKLGWRVLVLWQCELNDVKGLSRKLRSFVGHRKFRST